MRTAAVGIEGRLVLGVRTGCSHIFSLLVRQGDVLKIHVSLRLRRCLNCWFWVVNRLLGYYSCLTLNGLKECFPVPTRFQEVTGRLWWDYEAGLSREEHLRNNRKEGAKEFCSSKLLGCVTIQSKPQAKSKRGRLSLKGGKLGSPPSVCRVCSVCNAPSNGTLPVCRKA